MKKLPRSYSEDFNQSIFYLDDIENIVEIFREVSNDVNIETEGYSFDTVQDLAKLGSDTINKLEIKTSQPYIKLEFDNFRISLYIEDDSPLLRGVFEKIKVIVNRRNKSFNRTFRSSTFGSTISNLFLFLGVVAALIQSWSLVVLALITATVFAFLSRWAWNERFERYSIIVLKKRAENKSFLERNKDQIILIIISALSGAIITYVFTQLTK